MGSTESTGRSNRTEEEEEGQPENSSSSGGSMGAGAAIAIAAAGTVMAAWGISRMISNISNSESEENDDAMKMKAHGTESSYHNLVVHQSKQYESTEPTSVWSLPPAGRFKMNTDAVCNGTKQSDGVERGPSGYAGILRNDCGEWVRGFQGFIASTDIFTAEMYGIYNGLKLLNKPEHRGSILETDHYGASVLLNKPKKYVDKRPIVEKSRQLAREYDIAIKYVPRSRNRCADRLANMAVDKCKKYLDLKKRPQDSELNRRYDQDLECCKW
ncbi:uncharacterized protein LOC112504743 [Cynara cardunculus var. scolymus]|uniref:uncharacterized protein LOC112504743 n=1 Tax=Cynara cardunculus var. scolymus TaxID=59895 RepID=UPI000D628698|nr:uncharacterized protein LOC112504743 [Cynara cardunculus var. scolymus]